MTDDERGGRIEALLAEAVPETWAARDTDAVLAALAADARRRKRGRRIALALAAAAGVAGLLLDPSGTAAWALDVDALVDAARDVAAVTDSFGGVGALGDAAVPATIAAAVAALAGNAWLWRRGRVAEVAR